MSDRNEEYGEEGGIGGKPSRSEHRFFAGKTEKGK